MLSNSITAIVLTKNETLHIERCITSIQPIAQHIYVVDSFSTDSTAKLALELGAIVLTNPWKNYATQFNWALGQLTDRTDWVLRIDADEYFTPESINAIADVLAHLPSNITGVYVRRQMLFMGARMKFGGVGETEQLRLWRWGTGVCETRWMDEHIRLLSGDPYMSNMKLIDHNLNGIAWWIEKHNGYAAREAADNLIAKHHLQQPTAVGHLPKGSEAAQKRWIKSNIYLHLPLGLRAFTYFIYRYIFRFGFLDQLPGLFFHALQGLWYRLLVDAKQFECEEYSRKTGCDIRTAIEVRLGIKV